MWYIKQNGRSLTPGGPHYHRIWTWTFLEYSVTTCKQHTKQKRKENETKRCASQKIWHVELMKNENKYGYSVCIIVLFVCLKVLKSIFYHLDRFVFSNLICIYTIQQANYNNSTKKHIEKKRLLKFQKSCYNQVFYVVHLDSLEKNYLFFEIIQINFNKQHICVQIIFWTGNCWHS